MAEIVTIERHGDRCQIMRMDYEGATDCAHILMRSSYPRAPQLSMMLSADDAWELGRNLMRWAQESNPESDQMAGVVVGE